MYINVKCGVHILPGWRLLLFFLSFRQMQSGIPITQSKTNSTPTTMTPITHLAIVFTTPFCGVAVEWRWRFGLDMMTDCIALFGCEMDWATRSWGPLEAMYNRKKWERFYVFGKLRDLVPSNKLYMFRLGPFRHTRDHAIKNDFMDLAKIINSWGSKQHLRRS